MYPSESLALIVEHLRTGWSLTNYSLSCFNYSRDTKPHINVWLRRDSTSLSIDYHLDPADISTHLTTIFAESLPCTSPRPTT